jgi:ATP-dependent DNA helicase RecG
MSPDPNQLRLFPRRELIETLVSAPEDQWLERKSARVHPREVAEVLVGFANAEGGLLVIGVHNGEIEGVGGHDENGWRQAARDFADPPVRHTFELIASTNVRGDPDAIAVLEVEASDQVHRTKAGDVFLRVGDENRRLREFEVRELDYDKGQTVFDGRPVAGASRRDLDERLVAEYLRRLQTESPTEDVLVARGLLTESNRELVPTVAGILLFSGSPQRFLPEAWVRVLEYRGPERRTGERANVVSDERFDGPIPAQVEAVRAHLRRIIPTFTRLGSEGRFEPRPAIPEHAWQEAVVNAVLHRSYSMMGDHIRIELFSDRLEVESPGRLPGLVRIETIRTTRFARNPRIARAMADLGYGRELGEGVDRMFDEMARAGLPAPIFEQRPASVRVQLLTDPGLGSALQELSPQLARTLTALRHAGAVKTGDVMELLGIARPTALRHLKALEALGLVERVGALQNPRGYWRVPEQ